MTEADPPHYDLLFYSAPFSRANRHFPIGDLAAYQVHTVELVKHFEDIVTSITVPWFDEWDTVNLIKNTKTGYVYWVTASSISTLAAKSISFEMLFNAPTSVLAAGNTLTGVWDRLPANVCPYLKESIAESAMTQTSKFKLPTIYDDKEGKYVCWYEIVARSGSGSYQELRRYGGFAYIPTSRGAVNNYPMGAGRTAQDEPMSYPSLYEVINRPGEIVDGVSTDAIVTINVSARCPFDYDTEIFPTYQHYYLKNTSGVRLIPQRGKVRTIIGDVTSYYGIYGLDTPGQTINYAPNIQSLTITCTDNERKVGESSIINGSGAIIATIPTEYFEDNELIINIQSKSDFTNIYTDLKFNNTIIRLTEDKLPWIGNAWGEYQQRNMAYDRNSMDLAINAAREQRNIDAITSLSNSAMSGVMGYAMSGAPAGGILAGATAVAGIVGAEMQGRLSERTARAEQELKEKNVKKQLSNYFNLSQGIVSLLDNTIGEGYRIIISMPAGIDGAYYTTYFSEYGYRVQGKINAVLTSGYYKGRLIEIPINGVKGDLLNTEFIEGMKLEVII